MCLFLWREKERERETFLSFNFETFLSSCLSRNVTHIRVSVFNIGDGSWLFFVFLCYISSLVLSLVLSPGNESRQKEGVDHFCPLLSFSSFTFIQGVSHVKKLSSVLLQVNVMWRRWLCEEGGNCQKKHHCFYSMQREEKCFSFTSRIQEITWTRILCLFSLSCFFQIQGFRLSFTWNESLLRREDSEDSKDSKDSTMTCKRCNLHLHLIRCNSIWCLLHLSS